MSLADTQYLQIIENILDHGYYANNRTGIATYKLPHQVMQFNLAEEFPILTTKFVAFKTAIKELLWIWQFGNHRPYRSCHLHASIHPKLSHSWPVIGAHH